MLSKFIDDVINYKKRGVLINLYSQDNVIVIGDIGQINKLIEFSTAVCVVTSQVGFEALIYKKDVHVLEGHLFRFRINN